MSQTACSQHLAPDRPKQRLGIQSARWLETHSDFAAIVIIGIGLVARLKAASGTFLNPDEALHFFIANRPSWALAYKASLTTAHSPLLIFVLYWWRHLGTSELMLSLPSVIAGAAFCWIVFQWLKRIFEKTTALIGVIFVTLPCPDLWASLSPQEFAYWSGLRASASPRQAPMAFGQKPTIKLFIPWNLLASFCKTAAKRSLRGYCVRFT